MRKPFSFKQFNLIDEKSAMKLSTDAVLLGSVINTQSALSILDVGTGSGIIALMMAQKSDALIDAIDIDQDSIEEADLNFKKSKWYSRLNAIHCSLQDFIKVSSMTYDLIISNPPFFDNDLKSPYLSRTLSKHNDYLSSEDLLKAVTQLLRLDGRFWLIIPFMSADYFMRSARNNGLHIHHEFIVYPKKNKPANRVVLEFGKNESIKIVREDLVIRNQDGSYTNQYKLITKEFYINF